MTIEAQQMHTGRIALLERLKKAEDELLAVICELEDTGPSQYQALEKQRSMVVEAMGAVYRCAMFIDGDYLTP